MGYICPSNFFTPDLRTGFAPAGGSRPNSLNTVPTMPTSTLFHRKASKSHADGRFIRMLRVRLVPVAVAFVLVSNGALLARADGLELDPAEMKAWGRRMIDGLGGNREALDRINAIDQSTVLLVGATALGVVGVVALAGRWRRRRHVTLGGLTWKRRDFVAGWLITGGTGSGKTRSGVMRLLHEVFRVEANWGGLVIDDKGHFHESVTAMAQCFGRGDDVVLLRLSDNPNESPIHRFNLIGDPRIPAETYARIIVDTGVAMGHRNDQSFFRVQTRDQVAAAIRTLRLLGYDVTIENARNLLLNPADNAAALSDLRRLASAEAIELVEHWEAHYLNQPAEQLGGVRGSIANYLSPFVSPAIAEVFCRDSTVTMDDIDEGRILCVALPQRFGQHRRYVSTFLKQLYYHHALARYDLPAAVRDERNLLVLWADEAQHFVTDSEDGASDFNVIDRIREVNAAVVLATQSIQSFIPPLGKEKAEVVRLNLRNRLVFQAATEADALDAADFLGKRMQRRTSTSVGGGRTTRSYTREPEHRVKPYLFRLLKNHQCYLIRTDKRFRRRVLCPIEPDGRRSRWFPAWRRFLP